MNKKLVASLAIASVAQLGCYNSYFIDKTELEKLESSVEPAEVVTVYGDCPTGSVASIFNMGTLYAQADDDEPPVSADDGGVDDLLSEIEEVTDTTTTTTATDAGGAGEARPVPANRAGCKEVDVSASNAIKVVTTSGDQRVTPFNFIMSAGQLVSPEYDVLVSLNEVEGAKVQEFSTWKTIGTIVGVSAVAIGTFVAIGVLAPTSDGFQ